VRHPLDKKLPCNDARYWPMRDALATVATAEEADRLLHLYQTETRKRGAVYATALLMANRKHKRGPERAALRNSITLAHHDCFNHEAVVRR
jgi:hypothetical protein